MSYNEAVDPDLFPTYEGGDPSRFCKPDTRGYASYAGTGIKLNPNEVDHCGYAWNGEKLVRGKVGMNTNVEILKHAIDERAKLYGK